jgi:hypothetical protein
MQRMSSVKLALSVAAIMASVPFASAQARIMGLMQGAAIKKSGKGKHPGFVRSFCSNTELRKTYRGGKYMPHQGERECARRMAALS